MSSGSFTGNHVIGAAAEAGAVVTGLAVSQQLARRVSERDVLALLRQHVLGDAARGHLGEDRAAERQFRVSLPVNATGRGRRRTWDRPTRTARPDPSS